jgi:hypothetical protein
MAKNPCTHHPDTGGPCDFLNRSKDNPVCVNCKARLAYVQALTDSPPCSELIRPGRAANLTVISHGAHPGGPSHIKEKSMAMQPEPLPAMEEQQVKTKACNRCGKVLPADQFYPHKLTKDGLENTCKACRSKRARANYKRKPRGKGRAKAAAEPAGDFGRLAALLSDPKGVSIDDMRKIRRLCAVVGDRVSICLDAYDLLVVGGGDDGKSKHP